MGLAIRRRIWWDTLKACLDGSHAAGQIADEYLRLVEVYTHAEVPARA